MPSKVVFGLQAEQALFHAGRNSFPPFAEKGAQSVAPFWPEHERLMPHAAEA